MELLSLSRTLASLISTTVSTMGHIQDLLLLLTRHQQTAYTKHTSLLYKSHHHVMHAIFYLIHTTLAEIMAQYINTPRYVKKWHEKLLNQTYHHQLHFVFGLHQDCFFEFQRHSVIASCKPKAAFLTSSKCGMDRAVKH